MRIHSIETYSQANGPGTRLVFWIQGCTLSCPGCFNGLTHKNLGTEYTVSELFDLVLTHKDSIDGITFTGGEPLQQKPEFKALAKLVKEQTDLTIVLFTGLTPEELEKGDEEVFDLTDTILAGRFDPALWSPQNPLGHKTIILNTWAYEAEDFYNMPQAELIIKDNGTMTSTGINPVRI